MVECAVRWIPRHLVGTGVPVAHEAHHPVAGRAQEVGQMRPDQPARAGDGDREPRPFGPLSVPLEVQPRALVAEAEEALQRLAGRPLTDGVGEPAGRQPVLDVVDELAAAVVHRHEPVHVLPRSERALELPVDELPARHGAAHLRHPATLERTEPDVKGDAPGGHVATLLEHLQLLPRRCEPAERARPSVVREDLVGGRRHDAAPLEDRHRSLLGRCAGHTRRGRAKPREARQACRRGHAVATRGLARMRRGIPTRTRVI